MNCPMCCLKTIIKTSICVIVILAYAGLCFAEQVFLPQQLSNMVDSQKWFTVDGLRYENFRTLAGSDYIADVTVDTHTTELGSGIQLTSAGGIESGQSVFATKEINIYYEVSTNNSTPEVDAIVTSVTTQAVGSAYMSIFTTINDLGAPLRPIGVTERVAFGEVNAIDSSSERFSSTSGRFSVNSNVEISTSANGEVVTLNSLKHLFVIDGVLNRADYNIDNGVDGADFLEWQRNYGLQRDSLLNVTPKADGNENGVVDAADYAIWRDNYGSTIVGSFNSVLAVPEPSTLVPSICTFVSALCIRRRIESNQQER